MASDTRPTAGSLGEAAALDAYRNLGYRLIARNWRCRLGELDLVEGLVEQPVLVARLPGLRQLELVKEAKSHVLVLA